MNKLIEIAQEGVEVNWPDFRPGDTICVHLKVEEKNKERIQRFQGTVIKRRGQTDADKTFTVRKISNNIGVERIFPIHARIIEKIELIRKGLVRRARLYYLRGRTGQAAKIKHRAGKTTQSAKKNKIHTKPKAANAEVDTAPNPDQTFTPKE